MKKFHFWVKYAAFIKNENDLLKNSDVWYTWSNEHIQHVFQSSERSDQYFRRYDMLKYQPIGITLFCIETTQNNAIPKRIRIKMTYLLEYWSDRSEIWNTCKIWSLYYVYQKSEIFNFFFRFYENSIFYPKKKFLHTSRYFDLLSILFKSIV